MTAAGQSIDRTAAHPSLDHLVVDAIEPAAMIIGRMVAAAANIE